MASFPTSVIDYVQSGLHKTSNLGNSTLTTTINSGSTTFTVTSATNATAWPTTNFTVLIGTELIFCASRSGNVCTITARAFGGTTQADHAITDTVLVVLTAESIDAAYQEIIAIENVLKGITAGNISITGNIAVSGTVDGRDLSTDGTKLDGIESGADNSTGSNVGTGAGSVFKQKSGSQLQFKTIKAGTNVTVTNNTDDVTIASTDTGEANTASNVGTGTGTIYKQKTGVDLELKTIKAGTGITITNNASDITLDATGAGGGEVNTSSNLGTGSDGEGLAATKNGVDLPFKRIKAGSNITLTPSTNSVEIAVTGAGAPNDATYLALGLNASLTSERVFTPGNGLSAVDSGANAAYTLSAVAGNGITVDGSGIHLASAAAGAGLTYTTGVLDIVAASGSNLTANTNELDWSGVAIQKAGAAVATRPIINFIEGTNVTITTAENAGSDRVDVTIASSGGGGGAPTGAKYIVQTADGTLTAEQALDVLATGILKNTTGTGVLSIAAAGTDYAKPDTASTWSAVQTFNAGFLKASNIVNGTDTLTLPTATDTVVARATTDTLSNKTLGNSNIVTVREDRFTLQDAADTTKQAIFEVGTIDTATTRTFTFPNASTTIVGHDTTQTLSNKTLATTTTATLSDALFHVASSGDFTKRVRFNVGNVTTGTDIIMAVPNVLTQFFIVGDNVVQTLTNKTLTNSNNVLGGVTMTLGSDATGDIYYRAGGVLTRLGIGSTDQVLKVASGVPVWSASSAVTFTEVTGTSQTMAINSGYIANNASLVTLTLPTTAAVGTVVEVVGKGAGRWRIAQNASELIHFGKYFSTTGTGGYVEAGARNHSIKLVCTVADTEWTVASCVGGAFTVV